MCSLDRAMDYSSVSLKALQLLKIRIIFKCFWNKKISQGNKQKPNSSSFGHCIVFFFIGIIFIVLLYNNANICSSRRHKLDRS